MTLWSVSDHKMARLEWSPRHWLKWLNQLSRLKSRTQTYLRVWRSSRNRRAKNNYWTKRSCSNKRMINKRFRKSQLMIKNRANTKALVWAIYSRKNCVNKCRKNYRLRMTSYVSTALHNYRQKSKRLSSKRDPCWPKTNTSNMCKVACNKKSATWRASSLTILNLPKMDLKN